MSFTSEIKKKTKFKIIFINNFCKIRTNQGDKTMITMFLSCYEHKFLLSDNFSKQVLIVCADDSGDAKLD